MVGKSNKGDKRKGTLKDTDPIQEAFDFRIDVSMLVDNLQRSVTEWIKRHQIALNTTEKLRKAKRL